MLADVLLAIAHFLLIFALLAILVIEMTTIRPGLDRAALARLGVIDSLYGLSALALLIVGFGRVFWGLKGADFYLGNHSFWTKIALFVVVGLLSIPPTLSILKWRRQAAAEPSFVPPEAEIARARRFLHLEAGVFVLIPIFAVLMARGIG